MGMELACPCLALKRKLFRKSLIRGGGLLNSGHPRPRYQWRGVASSGPHAALAASASSAACTDELRKFTPASHQNLKGAPQGTQGQGPSGRPSRPKIDKANPKPPKGSRRDQKYMYKHIINHQSGCYVTWMMEHMKFSTKPLSRVWDFKPWDPRSSVKLGPSHALCKNRGKCL